MAGLPPRQRRRRSVSTSPFQNLCLRCDEQIVYYRDAVKTSRGVWVHKTCYGGADE